jgi:hypothetical protein
MGRVQAGPVQIMVLAPAVWKPRRTLFGRVEAEVQSTPLVGYPWGSVHTPMRPR